MKNKEGQEEERWRQVAPSQQDVDNAKLEALLTAVTQSRAASFVDDVDKTGLDKPELTVTVKSDEGSARKPCASRAAGPMRSPRVPVSRRREDRRRDPRQHPQGPRGRATEACRNPRKELMSRLAAAVLAACLGAGCAKAAPALPGEPPAPRASPAGAVKSLQNDLRQIFGAPIMARGVWAVDVKSLDRGETLYSLNAGKLVMPASNMKIVTLAAAAEVLGWDYRFTTTLETMGTIENGVLLGDLFIRSTGDPTINTRQKRADAVLAEWLAALKAAGITRIDGRIVGDDQAFDEEGLGDGWSWDYLQFGYAAPVGALQFNENTARLTVTPGLKAGEPTNAAISSGSGFTIVNRATTGAEGSTESIAYRRHP